MKESKKAREPRGVQGTVICTNSIEKPRQGGGFDRFTAGQVYDPANYDYPLGKPNFKPAKQTGGQAIQDKDKPKRTGGEGK